MPAVGMETSLHRELKAVYADDTSRIEVPWGDYRVDVVRGDCLIEIQHGSLAAIRDKVRKLLRRHEVLVVKPIVRSKLLVKCDAKGGQVASRRRSPKRGQLLDLFDELVHFTRVFPHRRLTLEVPLIDIEEWRFPGHGRRRRWRRGDQQTEDQRLVGVHETHRFRTCADLVQLVPAGLCQPFHTGHLAVALGITRWRAQRVAYCFAQMKATRQVGKQGNARLYVWTSAAGVAAERAS
jgi:hypothetical protein